MNSLISKNRQGNKEKGVLLPLFSLPSEYGIGCISAEAYRFIDWLAATGHAYWQILPLNPTGCADSPYQPLSSFAGNAYFIDPKALISQGLLSEAEARSFELGNDPRRVDYERFYDGRMAMLHAAYKKFASGSCMDEDGRTAEQYQSFCADNSDWLDDYAVFMALREKFGRELSWDEWPEPLRRREAAALAEAREECGEDIGFYKWTQFEFYREWISLREYANAAGVKIIGDMPIYVSYDSADCWADPEQFLLDGNLKPLLVAGVPPDAFAAEGQLWGNPLYDWEKMKPGGYRWWISRIRQSFLLYDVIRLDHFRGYEAYYAVPADAENAMNGTWREGPGIDVFHELLRSMGLPEEAQGADVLKKLFIAEDLGFLTDGVRRLLSESGLPGTKVFQFGFDGNPWNIYLPENYPENCVVYTGTHDNDTTVGWFEGLADWEQEPILRYLGMERPQTDAEGQTAAEHNLAASVCDALIEKALTSRADLCVIPLQDYLHLGSDARINVPGTVGANWCWRLDPKLWNLCLHDIQ